MTEVNRINANFRGLIVHNQNNNILRMEQSGNFSLTTKNIENISYNRLVNVSEKESIYKSKNDILLSSENGKIIIRNGTTNDIPRYEFNNPSFDSSEDTFFDSNNTDEIIKPFSSTREVNNLRENSFLIESLGDKSICLYSNNGLNQISHGDLNIISDENINLQTSKKLNLASMGYILLNSERMISSIEEDINFLSSTGEFKVGGNGISTIGLKVNSNLENNYLSLGKVEDKAERNLHININEQSYDNSEKNGILIESKNINNDNTYPDIQLNNYDKSNLVNNDNILTTFNFGIGPELQDINNLIYVKKENVIINDQIVTRIVSLNNFNFTNSDINNTITYVDTSFGSDTIKALIDTDKTKAEITSVNTDEENLTFDYQQAYINRENFGYLKTKTSSDINIGTNNNNIITIKNNGNIGINTNNPIASLQVENKFGKINNIRISKNKNYYNTKALQMKNGNYITIYNTLNNNLYNLEASIYNINNDLLSNFIILSNSYSFIEFDIDLLKGLDDKFIVTYCFFNNLNYILQSKIFSNQGVKDNLDYSLTHLFLEESCYPKVKAFDLKVDKITGERYNGYVIFYRDQLSEDGDINIYASYFSNLSSSIVGTLNLITNIDNYLSSTITNFKSIISRNFKFSGIEYDNNINNNTRKLYFIPSGEVKIKLNDSSEKIFYISLLNIINFTYNSTTLKPNIRTNNTFYPITDTDNNFEVLGANIKKRGISNLYIISYYLKNVTSNKINFVYKGTFDETKINSGVTLINKIDTIDDTMSVENYRLQIIPSIAIINDSNYIISYTNGDNIKFNNNSINDNSVETLSNFTNTNQPFNLRINDNSNNYQSIILFWNNQNTENNYFYNSINFKEITSISSFIKIKNENIDINIKNNGNINIKDILTVNKSNNTCLFNNLLIKESDTIINKETNGITGEIKYKGNFIYIYLDNGWHQMNTTILN